MWKMCPGFLKMWPSFPKICTTPKNVMVFLNKNLVFKETRPYFLTGHIFGKLTWCSKNVTWFQENVSSFLENVSWFPENVTWFLENVPQFPKNMYQFPEIVKNILFFWKPGHIFWKLEDIFWKLGHIFRKPGQIFGNCVTFSYKLIHKLMVGLGHIFGKLGHIFRKLGHIFFLDLMVVPRKTMFVDRFWNNCMSGPFT